MPYLTYPQNPDDLISRDLESLGKLGDWRNLRIACETIVTSCSGIKRDSIHTTSELRRRNRAIFKVVLGLRRVQLSDASIAADDDELLVTVTG